MVVDAVEGVCPQVSHAILMSAMYGLLCSHTDASSVGAGLDGGHQVVSGHQQSGQADYGVADDNY